MTPEETKDYFPDTFRGDEELSTPTLWERTAYFNRLAERSYECPACGGSGKDGDGFACPSCIGGRRI